MTSADTSRDHYQALLVCDVASLAPLQALALVGTLVNLSADLHEPDGLQRAIAIAADLESRLPSEARKTELHYFVGNAWSELQRLRPLTETTVWDWEQHLW